MKNAVVILDPDIRTNQQMVIGLCSELQKHEPWNVHIQSRHADHNAICKQLLSLKPDAVVGRDISALLAAFLQKHHIPFVEFVAVETQKHDLGSAVVPDNNAIGEMAAHYLLEQHFDHFATIDLRRPRRDVRLDSFTRILESRGRTVAKYDLQLPDMPDHPFGGYVDDDQLSRWLQNLPKPCAIFAHSDQPAAYVIKTCQDHNIRVPEDISIIGVDDDPLFCHTISPNLASIHVPYQRLGIEAARLIIDCSPDVRMVRVSPTTVVERESCRAPSGEDVLVSQALTYIQKECSRGIRVSDLNQLTGLSPQQLVNRFKLAVGFSPMEMILKHRISLAKQLLAETNETVSSIGKKSGFNSATQFYVTFRNKVGMSPREYREQIVP